MDSSIPSADHLSLEDTRNPNNLFQELVPSSWLEYTVDLYYSKSGNLLKCVPRQRLEVRGGEISKGVTRKGKVLQILKNHIACLRGARGVLTLQIFFDPTCDQILGIEINPRFAGGYPLSHAAGANFPSMLIMEYLLGESLHYNDDWENNLLMLRYDNGCIYFARCWCKSMNLTGWVVVFDLDDTLIPSMTTSVLESQQLKRLSLLFMVSLSKVEYRQH